MTRIVAEIEIDTKTIKAKDAGEFYVELGRVLNDRLSLARVKRSENVKCRLTGRDKINKILVYTVTNYGSH